MRFHFRLFVVIAVNMVPCSPLSADLIFNGDFESSAIVVDGQSAAIAVDTQKRIETDSSNGDFADSINGVDHWTAPLQGVTGVDNGLAKIDNSLSNGGSETNTSLFLNTWDTLMFQDIAAINLSPNDHVELSVDFATVDPNGARAGFLGLFSYSNNQYLQWVNVGNPEWVGFREDGADADLDFAVGHAAWGSATLSQTLDQDSSNADLAVVVGLYRFSMGTVYFDNLTMEVTSVPEPASAAIAWALIGFVICRRIRSPC